MRLRICFLTAALVLQLAGCTSNPSPTAKSDSSGQSNPQSNPQTASGKTTEASAPTTVEAASPSKPAAPPTPAVSKEIPKPPAPVVVPAGTVFNVYLGNEVGTKVSKSGDTFSGTLQSPVAIGTRVAIPAGADVSGRVTEAKPAGKFKGGAVLSLELKSVVVNGQKVLLHTEMITQQSTGKGKRTTGMIAGGTGGGAIIGGIAGGGKGAAIGAAVGAAAGTAGAAFTGKRDIVLPVETVVSFRLSEDIELKPVSRN